MNPLFDATPTDSNENQFYGHTQKNRAQNLIADWKYVVDQDLMADERLVGQEVIMQDQGVDAKHIPDNTPTFGVMGVRVYTKGDIHNSRLAAISLNTEELFNKRHVEHFTELGGVNVHSVGYIIDATSGTLTADPDTLVTVRSFIEHIDRAHAYKESTFVQRWAELSETTVKSPEAGGNRLEITRQMVDPNHSPPSGSTIIEVKFEEKTEKQALMTVKKAPDGFGTLLHHNFRHPERQGLFIATYEDTYDKTTFYTNVYDSGSIADPSSIHRGLYHPMILEWHATDLGNGQVKVKRTQLIPAGIEATAAWPQLTSAETEPETQCAIFTQQFVYQRVSGLVCSPLNLQAVNSVLDLDSYADFIAGTVPAGWEYSFKAIDYLRTLVTLRHINEDVILATEYEEVHNIKIDIPARLHPDTPFTIESVSASGGTRSVVSTNRSSDLSITLPCRFVITYHDTQPTPDEVFQFLPVDISIATPDWNLEERDILTNGGTLVIYYGATPYSFDIAESVPSVDDLIDMIGDEVLIADESERWKFNLWKRTKIYMTIPDIS